MLILHGLMGIGICLLFAIKAFNRDNKPPRAIFQFGEGVFGETRKWTQWYSWCLAFEIVTALMYVHTGLFYYEIAMSVFEAAAMTVGAFVIDRFFDMFMGAADINLPKPKIDLSGVKESLSKIQDKLTPKPAPKVDQPDHSAEEKAKLDELLKGH